MAALKLLNLWPICSPYHRYLWQNPGKNCTQVWGQIQFRNIYITPRRGNHLCLICGSLKDYTKTKPRAHPVIPPGTSIRQHSDSNLRQELCHPCVGLSRTSTITDSKPETILPRSIHLQEAFMMSSNKVVLSYRPVVNSEQPPSHGYRIWHPVPLTLSQVLIYITYMSVQFVKIMLTINTNLILKNTQHISCNAVEKNTCSLARNYMYV